MERRSLDGLVGAREPAPGARWRTEPEQNARLLREGLALVLELENLLAEITPGSTRYCETASLLYAARAELVTMGADLPHTDKRRSNGQEI